VLRRKIKHCKGANVMMLFFMSIFKD
jgi:hypothetical protein